jgi:predicted CDP-diglyceride synthetase/phosphatidate cytidylyltransferase
MTFLGALSSPYFWAYAVSAAVLLAAAWAGLFWLRRKGRPVDGLWRLLASLALFAGLVVAGVLLGREVFVLLVALASLFGCQEFARATGLYADWLFTGLVYLAILAVNAVALWAGYDPFQASPIYAVAALCVLPVLRNRAEGMLQYVALAVMAFVYFGYFLAHLSMLAAAPPVGEAVGYLFFLLFGSAAVGLAEDLADGKLGRRPVAPGISADKTWAGAAVALAASFLWCFTVGWTLPDFPWPALLLCALLFGIMGVLGELAMRYAVRGLRPDGAAAPHGPGLALDHLGRLVFVVPLFFRLVHVFAGLT